MTSNVLVRGLSSSMRASNASGSRAASSSGGFGQRSASAAAVLGTRPGSRLASAFPSLLEGGSGADADMMMAGGFDAHHHGDLDVEDAELASPVTPARPSGLGGGDLLGEPLMVRSLRAVSLSEHMLAAVCLERSLTPPPPSPRAPLIVLDCRRLLLTLRCWRSLPPTWWRARRWP